VPSKKLLLLQDVKNLAKTKGATIKHDVIKNPSCFAMISIAKEIKKFVVKTMGAEFKNDALDGFSKMLSTNITAKSIAKIANIAKHIKAECSPLPKK
jgi:hypothetical protein